MKIGINISDLTTLRYLIPVIDELLLLKQAENYDFDIELIYFEHSSKYNGLVKHENKAAFSKVTELYRDKLNIVMTSSATGMYDVMFSVENDNLPKNITILKHYTIQHGFDYVFRYTHCLQNTTYLMADELYANDIRERFSNASVVVPPIPVIFWGSIINKCSIEYVNNNMVTVFYPDRDQNVQANKLIDKLLATGYDVYVKQRRKHQRITSSGIHVYDDIWYPAESVILPLQSKFTIGFGSSAYVDLIKVGINYLDIDINPLPHFLHPNVINYKLLTSYDKLDIELKAIVTRPIERIEIDKSAIQSFLKGLIF